MRISYENAIRVPTGTEVFGDFILIDPNFSLRPEQSNNLNIGLFYKFNFSKNRFIALQADWFLRDQTDLIRLEITQNPNVRPFYINQDKVESQGIELNLKAMPIHKLNIDFGFTVQDIINAEAPNATNTNNSGVTIPNRPLLFYNLGLRYKFDNPLHKKHEISLFSYYNFVQEFSLIFESNIRNDLNFIPTQNQIDAGVNYQLADSGFTFSLQVNNLTNAEVFDNYRIPRPNRNFRFKIRYEIK